MLHNEFEKKINQMIDMSTMEIVLKVILKDDSSSNLPALISFSLSMDDTFPPSFLTKIQIVNNVCSGILSSSSIPTFIRLSVVLV
jgi:hypothetical protein